MNFSNYSSFLNFPFAQGPTLECVWVWFYSISFRIFLQRPNDLREVAQIGDLILVVLGSKTCALNNNKSKVKCNTCGLLLVVAILSDSKQRKQEVLTGSTRFIASGRKIILFCLPDRQLC